MDARDFKDFASSRLVGVDLAEYEQKFWSMLEERARRGEVFDAHKERAAYEYGIPVGDVTPEQRRVGKHLNFFRMYAVHPTEHREAEERIAAAVRRVCPKCGTVFECKHDETCWCMQVQVRGVKPDKEFPGECVCETCLTAKD